MSVLGRARVPDQPHVHAELTQLKARVDQALATVNEAMHAHKGNKALMDLALDIRNALRKPVRSTE